MFCASQQTVQTKTTSLSVTSACVGCVPPQLTSQPRTEGSRLATLPSTLFKVVSLVPGFFLPPETRPTPSASSPSSCSLELGFIANDELQMSGAGTGQVQGLRTVSSPVETKINKRTRDKMKRHKPSLRPDTKLPHIVCQTKCSILHCVSGEHRCSIIFTLPALLSSYIYIDSSG